MPTYKVTYRKLEEHLGEAYTEYAHPLRSHFVRELGVMWIFTGPINAFLLFFVPLPYKNILAGAVIIFSTLLLAGLFAMVRFSIANRWAERIRYLVNDPELLWLNLKCPHLPSGVRIQWERHSYPLEDSAIHALAHLYRKGTDKDLERPAWQNRASARRTLSRLYKRGLIGYENGDYCYLPWEFKVIDEYGRLVEARAIEKRLNKAWGRLLENEGTGEN